MAIALLAKSMSISLLRTVRVDTKEKTNKRALLRIHVNSQEKDSGGVESVVELGLCLVQRIGEYIDDVRAVAMVCSGHRSGQLVVVIVVVCRLITRASNLCLSTLKKTAASIAAVRASTTLSILCVLILFCRRAAFLAVSYVPRRVVLSQEQYMRKSASDDRTALYLLRDLCA